MIKLPARRLLIVGYSNPVAAEKYLGFSFERRFSVLSHFLQGTNSKNLSSRIVVSATAQLNWAEGDSASKLPTLFPRLSTASPTQAKWQKRVSRFSSSRHLLVWSQWHWSTWACHHCCCHRKCPQCYHCSCHWRGRSHLQVWWWWGSSCNSPSFRSLPDPSRHVTRYTENTLANILHARSHPLCSGKPSNTTLRILSFKSLGG